MKKKHIISEETLTHTVPCRQKQAKEYLQGRSPGVMRSYAPDAHADDKDGFVESDDTVHRLAHWRGRALALTDATHDKRASPHGGDARIATY